ncbi:MAG: UDP-2,3-diacylglucosamine diphosphatase [candidate division KSB1 bacterium]|nr:UDP-2,3-diacylglucosamine diphosphatase [candidate division KSB1 bacterium]
MSRLYIISDLHLGAESKALEREKEEKAYSFFCHVKKERGDLLIVGDLFDFWFEYRHAVPKRHFRILSILSLMSKSIPIHYLVGNHDFWLNSFISEEIGLIVHADDFSFQYDGLRIYVRHGDGLLKSDHGYRLLKKILRNRLSINLYRAVHPDIGIPLALYCSGLSRKAGEKNGKDYRDDDYRDFAFQKIEQGYQVVILGHTHVPALAAYQNGVYLNPGFWGKNFTFAVLDDGAAKLFRWDGEKEIDFQPFLPPGNKKYINDRRICVPGTF